MGLLDNQSQNQYNTATSGQGQYQFVTLDNIINAFMVAYVGEGKIISKVSRTDVQFHAMRAVQELSYDVFRSVKSQEIEVPATLTMMLPQDYVNYVKLVRVGSDGIERVLYPTGKTSNPFPIFQNTPESTVDPGGYNFTDVDNDGELDTLAEQTESDTWTSYKDQTEVDIYTDDAVDVDLDYRGRRYGLDPQYAQSNGTFFIDYSRGFIHFGSALSGKTVILKEFIVDANNAQGVQPTMPFNYRIKARITDWKWNSYSSDRINWGLQPPAVMASVITSPYSIGSAVGSGDIVQIAADLDNSKLYFGINGTWVQSGDPTSGATGTGAVSLTSYTGTPAVGDIWWFPLFHSYDTTSSSNFNFGNGYFGTTAVTSANADDAGIGAMEYDVPAGYYCLCTKNIKAYGG